MILRRLPEAVFVLGALYCVGVAIHRSARIGITDAQSGWNLFILGIPSAVALALALALFLPRPARNSLALVVGSLGAGIFPGELYFTLTRPPSPMVEAAHNAGRPVDPRNRLEVVHDLRSKGVDAVPYMGWGLGRTIPGPDGRALPVLGGVSMAKTVYCNESGQYAIYNADEHGFNNPPGLHGRVPLQIALIGDSFTQGACVPRDASLASRVRAEFPYTLNLGAAGAGPLSELARFIEYAVPLRPRVVAWIWFEGNDLANLREELDWAPLGRYLTAETSFGLKTRQADIDRVWRVAMAARIRNLERNRYEWRMLEGVKGVLLLRSIRSRLATTAKSLRRDTTPSASGHKSSIHAEMAVAERILATVQNTARSWGGELLVVYLSHSPRYCGVVPGWSWWKYCATEWVEREERRRMNHRDDLLAMFARLGLPVVDGHDAFAGAGRPADMFYFPGSHYSPAGYRVIAEALLREMKTRPLASDPAASGPSPNL